MKSNIKPLILKIDFRVTVENLQLSLRPLYANFMYGLKIVKLKKN